jgi:glycosyltransferase involved in cell wall biosynthesis
MILSILTPSVPSRLELLAKLCAEVQKQIGELAVEHLVLIDNRRRTIGEKRDALLRAARGRYVAFVDDDDWIRPDYVRELLTAAESNPDVITFVQESTVDGAKGLVEFHLGSPNEPFRPFEDGVTRRNAWHVCAWRRTLAIQSHFPAINYGEDWAFAAPLCALPNLRETHISNVLHEYRHSSATTLAPPLTAAL